MVQALLGGAARNKGEPPMKIAFAAALVILPVAAQAARGPKPVAMIAVARPAPELHDWRAELPEGAVNAFAHLQVPVHHDLCSTETDCKGGDDSVQVRLHLTGFNPGELYVNGASVDPDGRFELTGSKMENGTLTARTLTGRIDEGMVRVSSLQVVTTTATARSFD